MKKSFYIIFPLFFYIFYGLYISYYKPSIVKVPIEPQNPPGYYDYKGVTHVHSTLSTGSGKPEEIFEAAREVGHDFLILTDLNQFPPSSVNEGYFGQLLVIRGSEYSYLDSHLLYYDAPSTRSLDSMGQAQVYFSDLLTQTDRSSDRGLLILAHPFRDRYKWAGNYPPGLDGVEIINLTSLWEDTWKENSISSLWSILIYPFNQQLALLRLFEDPKRSIELWDQLTQEQPITAWAGNDSTAKLARLDYVRLPSYSRTLQIISNHVLLTSELTGNYLSDKRKILNALSDGQFYVSVDTLADPKGFYAEMRSSNNVFPMGSQIKKTKGLSLFIRLPQKPEVPFEVLVIRNGQKYIISNSQETTVNILLPGVYRVAVRLIPTLPIPDGKKWFTWIYTNNFYVKD